MTYLAQEESLQDGQPVELYRFSNDEATFLFTSGQTPVVFNTETYLPTPISRTSTEATSTDVETSVEIVMPSTEDFVRRYINSIPASQDSLTVYRLHSTDGGTPEVIVFFTGIVASVTFAGERAKIQIERGANSLDQVIPKQSYRTNCNHILYDSRCTVDVGTFSLLADVTAITQGGFVIDISAGTNTVPATGLQLSAQLTADATYFNLGHMERGGEEFRMVQSIGDLGGNAARLSLLVPFETLSVGTVLRLAAGCSHTFNTCVTKFSNIDNFGGFPFVPRVNPHENLLRGAV